MTKKLISIGEAAELLGVSIDTLRRWDKSGRLPAIRSGPRGHRYYQERDLRLFLRDDAALAKQWAEAAEPFVPDSAVYCKTRDEFQARLEKLKSVLGQKMPAAVTALVTAVAGEIGNNSFDHNLGNWPDAVGIYFSHDLRNRSIVLADRGLGIHATLKRVRPELENPTEALKVAFTETVSARQPEARGNGLKFVRDVIVNNPFTLKFQTGDACLELGKDKTAVDVEQADTKIRGCFATIGFEEAV